MYPNITEPELREYLDRMPKGLDPINKRAFDQLDNALGTIKQLEADKKRILAIVSEELDIGDELADIRYTEED